MQLPELIPLPDRNRLGDTKMLERAERLLEEMKTRHSVRDFAAAPVPRSVIKTCICTAGRAPSAANHQPWHFVAVGDAAVKRRIREAAEAEETAFPDETASEEWLHDRAALGIDGAKPFLEVAPWLIVVFAEGYRVDTDRRICKNYYIQESVGIATGMLITALHCAGLATLAHAPQPLRLLNGICGRPENEKPYLIVVAGHPAEGATVPRRAKMKKPLEAIASFL
jgi:nitroreductase